MNAEQDVFVCVFVGAAKQVSLSSRIPIWERMLKQRPHEIALCHRNIQACFLFRECNLPENVPTKHYIIVGSPEFNPWLI